MTIRYGAFPAEWEHFSRLGLTEDLLPVVSRPDAKISPSSKMKSLGKTPSKYYNGLVGGIKDWTSYRAQHGDVVNWSGQPDYGICIQTRRLRALDVDVENSILAKDIYDEIGTHYPAAPVRSREGSSKFLVAFELVGEFAKRTIQTDHGIIEFLATGQQFVAAGTHQSGARYEWRDGLPTEIPTLSPEAFERLWARLQECFGVEPSTTHNAPSKALKLQEAAKNDPVAIHLYDKGAVVSTERDGRLHIVCPFAAEHTSDTGDSSTTYFPAHTGGYDRGNFSCLHSHCAKRSQSEFLAALGIEHVAALDEFEVLAPSAATTIDSPQPTKANRYVVEALATFISHDPPEWHVKGVLPAAALAVVFGESGSGKTFFALDLVLAIARGEPWRGLRVRPGGVVYIAAEDARGVALRATAYMRRNGVDPATANIGFIADSPNFTKNDDVRDVLTAIRAFGPVAVIVVDTWAQVTSGKDENSGEDMGSALAYCRSLHKFTGALVLLIHHSGKDASKGARGWSGLRAAADAEIEITRIEHDRLATVTKQKNAEDGAQFGFKLIPVVVAQDADGDDISSCVLEHTAPRLDKAKAAKSKPALNVGRWYREALSGGHGDGNWVHLSEINRLAKAEYEAVGRRGWGREVDGGASALCAAGLYEMQDSKLRCLGDNDELA